MSNPKPTPFDALYPKPSSAKDLADLWDEELVRRMLDLVWEAYDSLNRKLSGTNWSNVGDIERSITELLVGEIKEKMRNEGGFLPVRVRHGAFERETRKANPAQPPEYDIAFVFYKNQHLKWPLEAKVLHTAKNTQTNLGDYVDALENRFLACVYAPFSDSGAMIAYLLNGNKAKAKLSISDRIGYNVFFHPYFFNRHHGWSGHLRSVPPGKPYPEGFTCHHLIMSF